VGTPVIDLSSSTLYVVSKSKDSGTSCTPSSSCHQRLHALNLADHNEKFARPYGITSSITVPGIPGAKGIGEKGATELIQKHGSVESAMSGGEGDRTKEEVRWNLVSYVRSFAKKAGIDKQ